MSSSSTTSSSSEPELTRDQDQAVIEATTTTKAPSAPVISLPSIELDPILDVQAKSLIDRLLVQGKEVDNIVTLALLAPTLAISPLSIIRILYKLITAAFTENNLEKLTLYSEIVALWFENAFQRDFLKYTSWVASKKYDAPPEIILPPEQDMMYFLFQIMEILSRTPPLLETSNRIKLFFLKSVHRYRQLRKAGLAPIEAEPAANTSDTAAATAPPSSPAATSNRKRGISRLFSLSQFRKKSDDATATGSSSTGSLGQLFRSTSDSSVHVSAQKRVVVSDDKLQAHSGQLHKLLAERSVTANDVAIAMTVLEERLFKGVKPIALIRMNWSRPEKQSIEGIAELVELAQRFNRVSFWVAKEVCSSPDLETRGVVLEFFMDVAQECLQLGNFSSLMQIIGGLNNIAVSRMKRAWTEVLPEKLKLWEGLNVLMESKANYRNYRAAITSRLGTPVIPFTGVLSRDITFIEEGNEYFIDSGNTINFEKICMVADVIRDLRQYQQFQYTLTANEQLLAYVSQAIPTVLPVDEDDILYSLSLSAETKLAPEDWKEEKKRLKKRKTQLVLATNIL